MSNFNLEEATSYIKKWLDEFVTQPNPLLNNFPPCPYAQQAILDNKVEYEVADIDINLYLIKKAKQWDEKIDVCVIFVPDIATGELSSLVKSTNEIYLMEDNFVALEDHPDDEENINGVIMKSHGASSSRGIHNSLIATQKSIEENLTNDIAKRLTIQADIIDSKQNETNPV